MTNSVILTDVSCRSCDFCCDEYLHMEMAKVPLNRRFSAHLMVKTHSRGSNTLSLPDETLEPIRYAFPWGPLVLHCLFSLSSPGDCLQEALTHSLSLPFFMKKHTSRSHGVDPWLPCDVSDFRGAAVHHHGPSVSCGMGARSYQLG